MRFLIQDVPYEKIAGSRDYVKYLWQNIFTIAQTRNNFILSNKRGELFKIKTNQCMNHHQVTKNYPSGFQILRLLFSY